MSRNLSLGGAQIYNLSVAEINRALLDILTHINQVVGLNGRAMIYDRVRVSDPTEALDAVNLETLQAGTAAMAYPFFVGPNTPLLASAPGTTYVELHSLLRQQVNFAQYVSVEGRVVVEGWGTESGSGKGVAITTSGGSVVAQVTWNGSTPGQQVGSFTAITLATDQALQVRVKGSSSTESLILSSVSFDLQYSIDVIND